MKWEEKYPDRFEHIVEYYNKWKTFVECADEYIKVYKESIFYTTIHQAIVRNNIERKLGETQKVFRARQKIEELIEKELSSDEMAKELWIGRNKVFELLREKDLKLPRGRKKKKFKPEYPEDIVQASIRNQERFILYRELRDKYPQHRELILNTYLQWWDLHSLFE